MGKTRRDLISGVLAAAGCVAVGRAIPAPSKPSAPVIFRRGVNTWPWFSMTTEYPPPRTDYAWPPFQSQRPVPHAVDLHKLVAAGFDFIRIPVDPGPFLSFSGMQRTQLLDMLIGAVTEATQSGLGVIVNLQASGTHYWTAERMFGSADAPAFKPYLELVSEVAHRLNRVDFARVALEPVNEPPQSCDSGVWTEVQTQLLNAARNAAPALTLVATGACGSMITGLDALDAMPLERFGPLLFTFHFYEPYLFSHQGAPWMREPVYRALNAVPWPASAGSLSATLAAVRARMQADTGITRAAQADAYRETERVLTEYFAAQPDVPFLRRYLAKVADWSRRRGVPAQCILMGEFGALRSDARYVAAAAADRARYIRDVRLTAESFGFSWAFWNLFDGMGVMDDVTRNFDEPILTALGLNSTGR